MQFPFNLVICMCLPDADLQVAICRERVSSIHVLVLSLKLYTSG